MFSQILTGSGHSEKVAICSLSPHNIPTGTLILRLPVSKFPGPPVQSSGGVVGSGLLIVVTAGADGHLSESWVWLLRQVVPCALQEDQVPSAAALLPSWRAPRITGLCKHEDLVYYAH